MDELSWRDAGRLRQGPTGQQLVMRRGAPQYMFSRGCIRFSHADQSRSVSARSLAADAAVRLLAMRIIERTRAGVRDRALLKAAALEGLGPAHTQ